MRLRKRLRGASSRGLFVEPHQPTPVVLLVVNAIHHPPLKYHLAQQQAWVTTGLLGNKRYVWLMQPYAADVCVECLLLCLGTVLMSLAGVHKLGEFAFKQKRIGNQRPAERLQ